MQVSKHTFLPSVHANDPRGYAHVWPRKKKEKKKKPGGIILHRRRTAFAQGSVSREEHFTGPRMTKRPETSLFERGPAFYFGPQQELAVMKKEKEKERKREGER